MRKDSECYWYVEDSLEWYYLQVRDRLHRRHAGKMETFAANRDNGYSVAKPSTIPEDANAALVKPGQAHGTHEITKLLEVPIDIWREVTNQREIEREIIARNRRHLQQIEREQGVTEGPLLKEIHANYGINLSAKAILAGTYETTYEIQRNKQPGSAQ